MDPERHTRALKNLCCKFYTIYCPKLYYWLPYTTLGCTLHSLFQAPGPQNWLKHKHENKMRGDWGEPPPPSPTFIFSPAFHLRVTPQSESLEQAIQFTILYYTKLHYTTLHCVCYCVMLCYAMLYTILRYMPYYAMSCHPLLCYAILYQNNLLYPWKKLALVGHEQWLPTVYVLAEFFLELPLYFFSFWTTQFSSVTVIPALIFTKIRNPSSVCTKQRNTVFHHCPSF